MDNSGPRDTGTNLKPIRHASLFSGIGGFDLAASWMGWENALQCEIDPFCQKVLRYHFPSSTLYGDIRSINGHDWRGRIDVLTGGFPCQPFSQAGRRRGTHDNRFLWPEMARVVRAIHPTWIVAENVRGLLSIEQGMVFKRVCSDLEDAGYEVQPFLIPACGVGAPHRRERVWIVAHDIGLGGERRGIIGKLEETTTEEQDKALQRQRHGHAADDCDSNAADTACQQNRRLQQQWLWRNNGAETWYEAATRLCRVDDGLPQRLDGITVPKWRRESLRSYGNAIVPAIAFRIFKAIQAADNSTPPLSW